MDGKAQVCGAANPGPDAPCCPVCGQPGRRVAGKTVLSMAGEKHLADTAEDGWRLCLSPDCDVVYFGRRVLAKKDLPVKVWFKESDPNVPVCYCRGVSAAEITRHILDYQCCATLEDIQKHTGANTGRECVTSNPAGG